MITHIRGKLTEKNPTYAIVECNGVGYFLHISLNTYSKIPDSEAVMLYTHLSIREDAHTLFGFADKGIGAKTAQRVIVDLKDKILKTYELTEDSVNSNNTIKEEALSALEVLGFSRKQVDKMVRNIIQESPSISLENIIKQALKNL